MAHASVVHEGFAATGFLVAPEWSSPLIPSAGARPCRRESRGAHRRPSPPAARISAPSQTGRSRVRPSSGGEMAATYILALDQGTTGTTRAGVRPPAQRRRPRSTRSSASTSRKPGWVEHDPEDIWASVSDDGRARRSRRRGVKRRRRSPRSASPTSARPSALWDRADRQAAAPRHRLAGPPHRRLLRRAARPGRRGAGHASGPAWCSTRTSRPPSSRWLLDHVAERARRAPRPASSPSAPSTASWSGGSPAARSTSPT